MAGADGRGVSRRAFCGAFAAGIVVLAAPPLFAQDATSAMRDLSESPDFRVRVTAAIFLGRTRPPGAREALETSLADPHPAVRIAAAAALGALGDAAAVAALGRREQTEPSASVRAQIESSVAQLKQGAASHQPAEIDARILPAGVRYVVRLGSMRNPSGVRGDELRHVLAEAARSRARALKGAAVVGTEATLLAQAAQRRIPVITLDGSLMALTEARVLNDVQVQARVEFAVRREQTLKGTLSGAATTFGSTKTLSPEGRRRLQDDAVEGAVQSALRGAEQGLLVAAL